MQFDVWRELESMRWKNDVLWGLMFMTILLLSGCGSTSSETVEDKAEAQTEDMAGTLEEADQEAMVSETVESRPDRAATRESVNLYGSFQEIYGCAVIYDPQEQRYSIYHAALAEREELDGLSLLEQVQVLAESCEGKSGYGQKNEEIPEELMLSDDNGVRKIYGKTGSGPEGKAWFVGFAEEENKREYFAVYLEDGYRQDQVSESKAKEIALDILDNNREFAPGEDDREIYRAFVEKNYPSGPASTLLRELTGDDRQELIVINGRSQEQVSMAVYTIKDDGTVVTLYEDTASDTHAGWNWLYLYEENGRTYLFRYLPILYQGWGTYSYDIFSLTGEGEEIPLYSGAEDFDMTGGEASEEQQERMGNFLEQVRSYQESSIPLVEIGEDYFDTKEEPGVIQKYNYVIDHDELGIRIEEQKEEDSDERA